MLEIYSQFYFYSGDGGAGGGEGGCVVTGDCGRGGDTDTGLVRGSGEGGAGGGEQDVWGSFINNVIFNVGRYFNRSGINTLDIFSI